MANGRMIGYGACIIMTVNMHGISFELCDYVACVAFIVHNACLRASYSTMDALLHTLHAWNWCVFTAHGSGFSCTMKVCFMQECIQEGGLYAKLTPHSTPHLLPPPLSKQEISRSLTI
jgi:hypothetical protein